MCGRLAPLAPEAESWKSRRLMGGPESYGHQPAREVNLAVN